MVGSTNKPAHVGRVLDDGSTQLYTYEYNGFGNVTKTMDPVGRTFSYIYAENGIDLLEVRQTRAGQSALLSQMTYNARHLPLTSKDAAGQMTTYTYNPRGQISDGDKRQERKDNLSLRRQGLPHRNGWAAARHGRYDHLDLRFLWPGSNQDR